MTLYNAIKTAREIGGMKNSLTGLPLLITSREKWLCGCEYKTSTFDNSDALRLGIANTRLIDIFALANFVKAKIKKEIDTKIDYDPRLSRATLGYVMRFPQFARIMIVGDANTCWFRLTAVKELMHLLMGTKDPAIKAVDLLKSARDARTVFPSSANEELDEEAAAFFIAIELLFSWSLHDQRDGLMERYLINYYPTAKAFMIPENIVRDFYDRHKRASGNNYATLSYEINMQLDKEGF